MTSKEMKARRPENTIKVAMSRAAASGNTAKYSILELKLKVLQENKEIEKRTKLEIFVRDKKLKKLNDDIMKNKLKMSQSTDDTKKKKYQANVDMYIKEHQLVLLLSNAPQPPPPPASTAPQAPASTAMVTHSSTSLEEAEAFATSYLPPHMQTPQFISYAARRVMALAPTAAEFIAWVDIQEKAADDRLRSIESIQQAHATAQQARATAHARRILEPEVMALVDEIFPDNFVATCMYPECGNQVTVAKFNVIRDGDDHLVCCRGCYRRETKSGKPGRTRMAAKYRVEVWKHHHGDSVFGECFHCKKLGRQHKVHFYLDAWEAGHNVAAANNGDKSMFNMAVLHSKCNKDQGTSDFADYHAGGNKRRRV